MGKKKEPYILTHLEKKENNGTAVSCPAQNTRVGAHIHIGSQKTNFFFLIKHDHNLEWNPGLMWYLAGGAKSQPCSASTPLAPSYTQGLGD